MVEKNIMNLLDNKIKYNSSQAAKKLKIGLKKLLKIKKYS